MKEINFKGKRIDTGDWVSGYYFKTPLTAENFTADSFSSGINRHCISNADGVVFEIDPTTLSEYTGIAGIYENDIVEGNPIGWTGNIRGVVFWCNDGWFVSDESERDREKRLYSDFFGEVKNLGNLFDNRKLLEGDL